MTQMDPTSGPVDARTDRSGAATARRRESIVRAAIVGFAERGYAGSSTREIAEMVGLKQGHLYYYYPAKEDLLFAVVDDLHQKFLDGLEQWQSTTEDDALHSTLLGHVQLVCECQQQVLVAYENLRFIEPSRRTLIRDKRDLYEAAVGRLIAQRMGSSPTDSSSVTRAVLGIVNWVYQWYSATGSMSSEQVARQVAGLALDLISTRTSTTKPKEPNDDSTDPTTA